MASDDKKSKITPAPKAEAAPAKKDAKKDAKLAADKTAEASKPDTGKTESSEPAADAPKSYSRGEGQKPVSQAYKDNWNAIYGKKKSKKKKR